MIIEAKLMQHALKMSTTSRLELRLIPANFISLQSLPEMHRTFLAHFTSISEKNLNQHTGKNRTYG